MDELIALGYVGLFIASFLAGSFVPFSSEVVLAALLAKSDMSAVWLLVVATVGNWLGEMLCFGVGRMGKLEWLERWMRVDSAKMMLWQARISRYGSGLAFFSFVPVVGNIIAAACGYFRCNVWVSALMMLVGKLLRYLLLLGGVRVIF